MSIHISKNCEKTSSSFRAPIPNFHILYPFRTFPTDPVLSFIVVILYKGCSGNGDILRNVIRGKVEDLGAVLNGILHGLIQMNAFQLLHPVTDGSAVFLGLAGEPVESEVCSFRNLFLIVEFDIQGAVIAGLFTLMLCLLRRLLLLFCLLQ